MKNNYDLSGISPKLREILKDFDERIDQAGSGSGLSSAEAVPDASGSAPTASEFNALLQSVRNAGLLKLS